MQTKKLSRREAEKLVKRERDGMPPEVKENCIYMKLFKNIPRSDLEMIFPNTRVRFRFFDKLRLGATAGGGLGLGAVRRGRQDRAAGDEPHRRARGHGRPRRHRLPPERELHEPEAALHGGDGAEPLLPRHGRQSRRHAEARRPRRRGGHQGRDAALQRADEGERAAPGHPRHRRGHRAVPRGELRRQRRLRHLRRAGAIDRRRSRRRAPRRAPRGDAAEGRRAAHRQEVGRLPRRAARAGQRRGHGVRRQCPSAAA